MSQLERAGRILRLWDNCSDCKNIYFHSKSYREKRLQDEFIDIGKRWDKLMQHHEESRKLTDLPVLTSDDNQLINMPDFASGTKVKKGILNLHQADDKDVLVIINILVNYIFIAIMRKVSKVIWLVL